MSVEISVVTSIYKTEKFLRDFLTRTTQALTAITNAYEIILVNDGSPGNGTEVVLELKKEFSNVVLIELSRNFGQHPALMAGMSYARGQYIFLIDGDTEEPPEVLPELYRRMNAEDWDVIYGVTPKRKGGVSERIGGMLFYKLFSFLSPTEIPHNVMALRLMRKEYVDALLEFEETHLFLGGVFIIAGFKQLGIPIEKKKREGSSYTLERRIRFAMDALLSFSDKPIQYIANLGILITLLSALMILFLLYKRFVLMHNVEGWTSVMVSVWLLGGLILLSVGVVGKYVGKIFIEAKKRPRAIVRRIYR